MKALIGGIVGALLLGGVLLLFGGRTNAFPQMYALDASTVDPMLVNCGEGRQALVRPVAAGQRVSQVECVAAPAAYPSAVGLVPAVQTFAPVAMEWFRDKVRALAVERQPPPPLLQGRDVLALGLAPGPEVGRIVRAVYEQQLDGAVTTLEEARAAAAALLAEQRRSSN